MPKAFLEEFRRTSSRAPRKGEAPLGQIAKDFGIHEGCLHRWPKIADREDGISAGRKPTDSDESAELREDRKRIKLLDLADDGEPVTVTCRVLGFSTQRSTSGRKIR